MFVIGEPGDDPIPHSVCIDDVEAGNGVATIYEPYTELAQVFCAAPELLVVAKEILDHLENRVRGQKAMYYGSGTRKDQIAALSAVIAKAEGS